MKIIATLLMLATFIGLSYASTTEIYTSYGVFGSSETKVCLDGACTDFEDAISAGFMEGNKVLLLQYDDPVEERVYIWAEERFITQAGLSQYYPGYAEEYQKLLEHREWVESIRD